MWIHRINNFLSWSFYALFFLVPLIIWPSTYELFEFNKMWFTFGIGLLILFLWIAKMVIAGKVLIRRTPLDIPLILFLLSQIISTVFSLDPHISVWGYYSRFNGGLLSTLTYIFLYYAYASNFTGEEYAGRVSIKTIFWSILSGLVVTLWGLPSHFGYDPTCFMFRGSLDVSCWTDAFQPKVRIFSTLGQPNWMAAYISVIIPLTIAYATKYIKPFSGKKLLFFGISAILMYMALLYTRSQSGFLGFWIGMVLFIAILFIHFVPQHKASIQQWYTNKLARIVVICTVIFLLLTFFIGTPISLLDSFTYNGIMSHFNQNVKPVSKTVADAPAVGELGGTDSGTIRLIVWRGALDIFKEYPLFGSGVETYAFAYYKVRPAAHNLTSEWDYLYNKAHNEYLNYLATTGIFGLGTYLAFVGLFLFLAVKKLLRSSEHDKILGAALLGSFVSMLISNFFGFSVVIINLYIFLIPALFFDLYDMYPNRFVFGADPHVEEQKKNKHAANEEISIGKISTILLVFLVIGYLEFMLYWFWLADQSYALGYNLDHANEYVQATSYLEKAVSMRPGEDVFKDEYSVNLSTLALIASEENQATEGAQFAQEATSLSDEITQAHPNNILFFKDRTRVYYALAQINKGAYTQALAAIQKAHELAPTDAKVLYNEALIYQQLGDNQKAADLLNQTIQLKPNYGDALYALALLYAQEAKDEKDPAIQATDKQKARDLANTILKNVSPHDKKTEELLKSVQ